jgi:hypothetical protein
MGEAFLAGVLLSGDRAFPSPETPLHHDKVPLSLLTGKLSGLHDLCRPTGEAGLGKYALKLISVVY